MAVVSPNNASEVNQMNVPVEKPCPSVAPVLVSNFDGSTIGWNAILVGLLSCVLAIGFLLICLYYLAFRRRYGKQMSDGSMPVAMTEKLAVTSIPVSTTSRSVSTTVLNEPGKETVITTYSEQTNVAVTGDDVTINMNGITNGHVTPTPPEGLLTNGNADQSELRLLQHEHN